MANVCYFGTTVGGLNRISIMEIISLNITYQLALATVVFTQDIYFPVYWPTLQVYVEEGPGDFLNKILINITSVALEKADSLCRCGSFQDSLYSPRNYGLYNNRRP